MFAAALENDVIRSISNHCDRAPKLLNILTLRWDQRRRISTPTLGWAAGARAVAGLGRRSPRRGARWRALLPGGAAARHGRRVERLLRRRPVMIRQLRRARLLISFSGPARGVCSRPRSQAKERGVTNELLLVGSIPFDTPEEVFAAFGAPLGKFLFAKPASSGARTSNMPAPSRLDFSSEASAYRCSVHC